MQPWSWYIDAFLVLRLAQECANLSCTVLSRRCCDLLLVCSGEVGGTAQ